MQAICCSWSTPLRSAATPRNTPGYRRCGRDTATRGWLFSACRPTILADIHATAQGQYHVTFPITEKVAVKGKDAHPFYKWAAGERPLEGPRWNFHKYLIGRDGYLKAGFSSAVEPTDPLVIAAVERELAGA